MGMTQLYGLLGWPVGHSVSPSMMNAAFAALGLDATYLAFAVTPERLTQALSGLQVLGARGVNVTIPHKQGVFEQVTQTTEEAVLAAAVNTVRFEADGSLTGHNTDVAGWWQGVATAFEVDRMPRAVTVLGAGGAARAVVSALCLNVPDVKVHIVARQPVRAAELAAQFSNRLSVRPVPWEQRNSAIDDAELVVNTTPIGMWPHPEASPVNDPGCFHKGQVVQDIVYRPLRTQFIGQAELAGASVLDGLRMLVDQGALSFQFWTGQEAPRELMYETALQSLGQSNPG